MLLHLVRPCLVDIPGRPTFFLNVFKNGNRGGENLVGRGYGVVIGRNRGGANCSELMCERRIREEKEKKKRAYPVSTSYLSDTISGNFTHDPT